MKKIKFKKFKGHFYVTRYQKHYDRIEIYDQNKNYVDMISLQEHGKGYAQDIIDDLKNLPTNPLQFFDYLEIEHRSYSEYLTSIIKEFNQNTFLCALNDLYKLNDKEFCKKYSINKIGDTYVNLCWGVDDYE